MNTQQLMADVESRRQTFHDRGVLRFAGLLPAAKVKPAQDATRHCMELAKIFADGMWQTDHLRNAPINADAKFGRKLKGKAEFDDMVNHEIPFVVDQLLNGQPTFCGMRVPQPLFTLPNADSWTVPSSEWHLDVPRLPESEIPGIQMFTFLESVAPTGGGTLIVAGSHRLLNGGERISSKDVKRRLKEEPYFRDLMSKTANDRDRFVRDVDRCGDVELQVVEMHGEPGDVYFVDMRVLHTIAPNATRTPRIMLTRRYFLESLRDQIFATSEMG